MLQLLPEVITAFRDRGDAMATLDGWYEQVKAGGSRLWMITGEPGIGKTTLGLTWIGKNRKRFGHAQIAVECGGGAGEGHGRGLEEVCLNYFTLTRTLLGEERTLAAKLSLMSAMIDGQPAVVLLDDVRSWAQIRPFLECPGVVVIATCRTMPPKLATKGYLPRVLPLEGLPGEAVRDLFEDLVGTERTGTEPGALDQLVGLCAGSPLIASHAAGTLYDKPYLRLGELAGRMKAQGRLPALKDGQDEDVVSPFEAFYRELSPPAARLYRVIGMHPVQDFDLGLVTAVFAERPADGLEGLEELAARGIVRRDRRGRYVMQDLTYEHARLAAARDESVAEQRRVRGRIADYYLRSAIAASQFLSQRWTLGPLYDEEPPFPLPDFRARTDARTAADSARASGEGVDPVSWTRENLPAIMACMERAGEVSETAGPVLGYQWQMAEATNGYFTREGPLDDRATILGWAEQDAEACQDFDARARIQVQWGEMALGLDDLDEAEKRFKASLDFAERGSEYRGKGAALEWLGITERRRGRGARALEYFDLAVRYLDPARLRSRALLQMHRADALALLGDPAALETYLEAAALFRQLAAEGERDHANEGKVLDGQARLLEDTDRHRARALMEEALTLFQAADRPRQEAKAWEFLGDTGDGASAWQKALDLFERLRLTDARRVQRKLSASGDPEGRPDGEGGSQPQG